MNPLQPASHTWYMFAAQVLVIMWGTIVTFGPPVFLYLFWRGFVDVHRIANALDKQDWQATDTKYVRLPRRKDKPTATGDSIVPSAFGR